MSKENPLLPDYYKDGIEPIKFISSWKLNFNLGNVVKYIARPRKAENTDKRIEDLGKAITYLQFEIDNLHEVAEAEKIFGA